MRFRAVFLPVVVGLACGGSASDSDVPEDPEQRAIERVLSEPTATSTSAREPTRAAAADPAVPLRDDFPWLADLVPTTDVVDPDAEVGDPKAWGDSASAAHRLGRLHLAIAIHGDGHDARVHLDRALGALDQALDHDAFGSRDEALFDRFLVQLLRGDAKSWRDAALVIVRDVPLHPRIPYVFLAFGETSLDAREPAHAISFFDKAITFDDAHARAFAFHDLAWAHLQSSPPDPTHALEAFVRAIEETRRPEMPFPASARALRTAARRDLVVAYAQVGRPDRAEAFFTRVGRGPGDEDMVAEMLALLAAAK